MATDTGVRRPSPATAAQSFARVELMKRHRAEYDEIYRAKMIELGGTPKPTTQEKIDLLKQEIEKLQSQLVESKK
jgi:hypothetical protein